MSARTANGAATVTVRDHGGGLDDEALAHVFDRFWQADRARVGKGAGPVGPTPSPQIDPGLEVS